MLFTEFEFIFYFVPLLLALYHIVRNTEQRITLLFAASLLFYSQWDWRFLPLILFSILTNFYLAKKIDQEQTHKRRKRLSVFAVTLALFPLFYFKYATFFAETLNLDFAKNLYDGLLPLGISFYTFQQITYIIDIYQKKQKADMHLSRYGFFVTFFPQLIAGPIVHYKEIVPQIGQKICRNTLFGEGLIYFTIGYIKKFIIADNIAALINPIYSAAAKDTSLHILDSMTASLGYTFQLYFDFSGYSDMAIGLALLFGFRLPINFNSPYKSGSIIEFWRRWHITLSRFLKDYIYIPFGGSRYKTQKWKRYRNLMLTMLIGGLWHGASWTFVAWGGLHGLALIINHKIRNIWGEATGLRSKIGFISTFVFVVFAWVLFRAESKDIAFTVYNGFLNIPDTWDITLAHGWIVLAGVIVLLPNSHDIVKRSAIRLTSFGTAMRPFLAQRVPVYLALSHLITMPFVYGFYTSDWDKEFYRNQPVKHHKDTISNAYGDYRSNLYVQNAFVNDTKKIFIVGSSFTNYMGQFSFERNDMPYESVSIGIGGNYIFAGLRTATNLLKSDPPEIMVFGISALNMIELNDIDQRKRHKKQRRYTGAFSKQCQDTTNTLGFDLLQDRFSSCHAIEKLSLLDVIDMYCCFSADHFYQLHGFLEKVSTYMNKPEQISYPVLNFTAEEKNNFSTELETDISAAHDSPKQPHNIKNGLDKRFNWNTRGTIKSLSPEGSLYRAFSNLAKQARQQGTTLILYNTPTVLHKDYPDVYPEGYYERYQHAVSVMCEDHQLKCYDFSDLYPWHGEFMRDFIHPVGKERKRLHQYLLYKMEEDDLI